MKWLTFDQIDAVADESTEAALRYELELWKRICRATKAELLRVTHRRNADVIYAGFSALCTRFSEDSCQNCPIHDQGYACCKEWEQVERAYNRMIDGLDTHKKFIKAARAGRKGESQMCLMFDPYTQVKFKKKLPREGVYYKIVIRGGNSTWRSCHYKHFWRVGTNKIARRWQFGEYRITRSWKLFEGGAHFYRSIEDAARKYESLIGFNRFGRSEFAILRVRIKKEDIDCVGYTSAEDKDVTVVASKCKVLGEAKCA